MKLFCTLLMIITTLPIYGMRIELSDPRFSLDGTERLFNYFIQNEEIDSEQLRNLLHTEHADPNAIATFEDTGNSNTPLDFTLEKQNLPELMQLLIDQGADVNKQNPHDRNRTVLHLATLQLREHAIAFLLQRKANIHALWQRQGGNVYTPLSIVCAKRLSTNAFFPDRQIATQKRILKLLLDAGAQDKLNEQLQENHALPLELASFYGKYFLIPTLVEHGANLESSNFLSIAMQSKSVSREDRADTIKALLDAGANPYKKDKDGSFLEWNRIQKQEVYKKWKQQHRKMREKLNDFISKATSGNLSVVIRIPQPDAAPRVGMSPAALPVLPPEMVARIIDHVQVPWTGNNQLDLDKKKQLKQQLKELANNQTDMSDEALQEKIQELNTLGFPGPEILGLPTSHWIYKHTNLQILQHCIQAGMVDKDEKIFDGNTLLHTAVALKKPLDAPTLACFKDMINTPNRKGATPSVYATKNYDALLALVEAGADVHVKNSINESLLYWAAHERNKQAISLLVSKGVTSSANQDGWGPLQCYVASVGENNLTADNDIIELLFEAGAKLDDQNDNGQWLRYAQEKGINLQAIYDAWLQKKQDTQTTNSAQNE